MTIMRVRTRWDKSFYNLDWSDGSAHFKGSSFLARGVQDVILTFPGQTLTGIVTSLVNKETAFVRIDVVDETTRYGRVVCG